MKSHQEELIFDTKFLKIASSMLPTPSGRLTCHETNLSEFDSTGLGDHLLQNKLYHTPERYFK